ncbi:MAG: MATE family efflux transporter [Pirellulales bacterium]
MSIPTASPASLVHQAGTFFPLVRLALPVLAGHLLDMLVGFTDTWLTGNYLATARHLAAINLVAYLLWLMVSLFSLVSIGTTALVARFVGAEDWALARHTANQALFLGALICAAPIVLVAVIGRPLVASLGLEDEAATLAVRYLWIVLPAVPAIMLEQVGVAALRGAGDTVTGMLAMIVTNAVDMVASFALVRGLGPIPALGWDGLAIGTTIGYYAGGLIILARLVRGRAGLKIVPRMLRPDGLLIRRLLRISLPGGIDILAMIGCHLLFLRVINALGNLPAAAHGIAIKIESLSFMPGAAFQIAAATMVGQFLGAGQSARATRTIYVACGTVGAIMCTIGTVLYLSADWLGAQFVSSGQAHIGAQAGALVRIVCLAQPALAVLMVLTGAMRGAGDTRWPLAFTFVGFVVVRIPLGLVLAWSEVTLPWSDTTIELLDLGVRGAWYAMVIDLYIRCALAIGRFLHGGWKKIEV